VNRITQEAESAATTNRPLAMAEAVLDGLDALVYVSDLDTHEILFVNARARRRYGDVVGRKCWAVFQEGRSGPCPFCTNPHLVDPQGRPTGTVVWEQQSALDGRLYERRDRAVPWVDGRLVRLEIAVEKDQGEHLDELVREGEARLRAILEQPEDGLVLLDGQGTVVDCNAAARVILSGGARLAGTPLSGCLAPEDRPRLGELINHAAAIRRPLNSREAEVSVLRDDGGLVATHVSLCRVPDDAEGRLMAVVRDLSRHHDLRARVDYLAHHDPLTGLPIRGRFAGRLDSVLASSDPETDTLAVVMLSLDGLDTINDSMGYEAGNAVIQEVARRLRNRLGRSQPVGRLGANAFALLLQDAGSDAAVGTVVDDLRRVISRPVTVPETEVQATCRVGISLYPRDGITAGDLIGQAESALHAAHVGADPVRFFDASLTTAANERLHLEAALRTALETDQFEPFYQPQTDMEGNRIVGAEALIRWRHPDQGLISPGRFIPVAEETGRIVSLGEWMLRAVCRDLRQWYDHGRPAPRVAVNISAAQFHHGDFVERVQGILDETGVDPSWLELEVTESTLITDAEGTLAILKRLKAVGVALAVDDFGTGYSSLAYLRQFPLDTLKIDRAFIRNIEENEDDRLIVTAIISLAHCLGLTTVAEGIETESQRRLVGDLGGDVLQGFLMAKPQPAADFDDFRTHFRPRGNAEVAEDLSLIRMASQPDQDEAEDPEGVRITWKRSMSVDVVSLDRQHQEMVEAMNRLLDLVEEGAPADDCRVQLQAVVAEARDHFVQEERLMRNIGFPHFHRHKEKHDKLLSEIDVFMETFQDRMEQKHFRYIQSYLKYWLLRHLMSEDQKIKTYLMLGR